MALRAVAQAANVNQNVDVYTWAGLTQATLDTGAPVSIVGARALCAWLAAGGTLGVAGAVLWEFSVDGGATYLPMSSEIGIPVAASQVALATPVMLKERGLTIRPRVTAGDGTTTLTAVLTVTR